MPTGIPPRPNGLMALGSLPGLMSTPTSTGATERAHTSACVRNELIVLKETTLKDAINSGSVKIAGSQAKLEEMLSHLDTFDFWFNIVTP